MGLLAPLFLAGLLAVAIPIVVHLVHRERKEPLAFPSLMFLRRVPFRSAKRQRIRYWLLFLLRTAALVLIATAFARPWINRPQAAVGGSREASDVVVLVDRSYSMSAAGVWERAQEAAKQAVEEAGRDRRVAVIAFAEQAEVLARLDEPRAQAMAAVQNIKPGSEVTRYAPAFKLAASQLNTSRGPAEIVVITDRQRGGWRGMEQVPVPPNSTVRVVDVRSDRIRNLAVTDVKLARSQFAGRQRIVPSARIVNRDANAANIPVGLYINERKQQQRTVRVPGHGSAEVSFDAMFADALAGEIRIEQSDDLERDNHAYFTTGAGTAPAVRVVSSNRDAAFYFEQALNAGNDGRFSIHTAQRAVPVDLNNTSVLVVLDGSVPEREVGEFVRNGGGLIVAGTGTGVTDLLPVRAGDVVRLPRPASLVSIDALHPVFEPFRASAAAQFASAQFNEIRRGRAVGDAQVLARFDDGSPALLERRVGRGRVLYWASSFTRAAGDLVLQPVFVPFVQQLVRYAGAGLETPAGLAVGSVIDVNNLVPADREAIVYWPGGQRIRVPAGTTGRSRSVRLSEAGIYQVRGTGEGATTQLVAVNVDVAESDLTPLNAETFQDAITIRTATEAVLPAALQPHEQERQQNIWWYLLLIAFVFLAIETFWGNRISAAWRT